MAFLFNRSRKLGTSLSTFTERWIPDSWVICMMLTSIALSLAVCGASVNIEDAILAWGDGMLLIPPTL